MLSASLRVCAYQTIHSLEHQSHSTKLSISSTSLRASLPVDR